MKRLKKIIKGFSVSLCAAGSTLTGFSFLAQSTEVKETTAATEGKTAETETARTFADNSGAKASEEDAIYDNYPITDYFVIGGDGNYFAFGIINSIVAGKFPNTDYKTHNLELSLSYDGKEWSIDNTDEAANRISAATKHCYPDEAWRLI